MSNKIPLLDLVHESEIQIISSYLPYLSCDICKSTILDPKYCQFCRKSFCSKCICSHKPKVSRHIEELTDKLTCKCKYNCNETSFPLKNIYEHLDKCRFKDKYLLLIEEKKMNNINNFNNMIQPKDTQFKQIEMNLTKTFQEANIEALIGNIESTKGVQCFKCANISSTKIEYIKHALVCLSSKEKGKEASESIHKIFNEEFDIYRTKLSLVLKEKLINMRNIYSKEINWLIEDIKETEKECNSKEMKIEKYNQTKDDSLFMQNNSIKALQEIESNLKKESEKLTENYNTKMIQFNQLRESSNESLITSNQSLIDSYLNKQTESSWIKELITTLSIGFEGSCTKCGSDTIEMNTCISCKQKYCKGKCVSRCSGTNCNNYCCPKCTIECNLCHKKIYCDRCKKKCFFEQCSNVFCVPCYKKNEHQSRSTTTNCKFFICEKEKVNSCLMTTLYCSKCDKRLCNDCLVRDINHYDTIKIFK